MGISSSLCRLVDLLLRKGKLNFGVTLNLTNKRPAISPVLLNAKNDHDDKDHTHYQHYERDGDNNGNGYSLVVTIITSCTSL